MYDLFVSCIPQIVRFFIYCEVFWNFCNPVVRVYFLFVVLRLPILIPLYLLNLYCLISALIFYFNIKFHFLIHPEYSLQYVLMGRSILILFSKCLTLPVTTVSSPLLCSILKQRLWRAVLLRDFIFFPPFCS